MVRESPSSGSQARAVKCKCFNIICSLIGVLWLAGSASALDDWYTITPSDSVVSFGAVSTAQPHSTTITLTNNLTVPVSITAFGFEEDAFVAAIAGQPIPPSSTKDVYIYFVSDQNVDYTDFLRIELDNGVRPLIVQVSAEAHHPDTYYDSTQNKWAEELKTALTELIDDHNSLGYTIARDHMYGSIDNDDTCPECPETGCVECVYTGRIGCFNTRAGATDNGFNCEHTWPQSFSGEMEPMKSDIFHLYPSDMTANNMRGSFDFGVVTSATWSQGGSKLGTDSLGQTVFEPRDVHKGNVARTHFYYVIRYDGNYVGYVDPPKMEAHFRNWHVSDAVDSAEEQRNEDIYALQYNRNPFIDHPEFVDRISSFFGTAVWEMEPEIAVSPLQIDLGTIGFNTAAYYYVAVINTGTDTLSVSSVSSTNPDFTVDKPSMDLAPEIYEYVRVTYASAEVDLRDSTMILISSNDSDENQIQIPVTVEVSELAGIDGDISSGIYLHQNYPNPFGPKTTIAFSLDRPTAVDLVIYNVEGQKVGHIIHDALMLPGAHRVPFDGSDLPSGVYYYRLSAGDRVLTKRMLLLKGLNTP
jgi:endonuclease I